MRPMELTKGFPHQQPREPGRMASRDRTPTKFSGSRLKSKSPASPGSGWLVAITVASMVGLVGCDRPPIGITEHPSNKAKGVLYSDVRCKSETKYIDGEWNHGFNATVTVRNIGQTGFIKVSVYLKSSQGEWVRTEELPICAKSYKTLNYFFPEPTHSAVNIQCRADISP
jgi:hypothetical protein